MDTREQIIQSLMGQLVHVEVDRPIGYVHGDIVYPVNYGYIPGVIAGDGEEQDAYILGVTEPLAAFDGRVVGAVRRRDDNEDKLIVAPDGMVFHQAEIAEAVHFQEQYFDYTVDSLVRRSCGVIPFRQIGGEREFLIVLQTNNCWSFPKGHMDRGETEIQTALRELYEETGLVATLIPGAKTLSEYPTQLGSLKQVVLFLGEVQGNVVPQDKEVVDWRWVRTEELKEYLQPDTCRASIGLLHFIYPDTCQTKQDILALLSSQSIMKAMAYHPEFWDQELSEHLREVKRAENLKRFGDADIIYTPQKRVE